MGRQPGRVSSASVARALGSLFALGALFVATLGGCATMPEAEPVEDVALSRYLGTWYEIASIPQWFSRGCTCTTATYESIDAATISVVNRCRKGGPEGELDVAEGRGVIPDPSEPGDLRVSFFGPFRSPYRILELGDEGQGPYTYAVVGSGKSSLWVLSRTPDMDPQLLDAILKRRATEGFEVDEVQKTRQEGCWEERRVSSP